MKSTGIVRKMDPLGRLVIPKELRNVLDIQEGEPLEVFTQGEYIILKKYEPGCYACGKIRKLHEVCGIKICEECAALVAKASKEWTK